MSAASFAFASQLKAEFTGAQLPCASGLGVGTAALLPALLPATPLAQSSLLIKTAAHPGAGCVVSLDAVLGYFGVTHAVASYAGWMVAYLVVMHVITYCALLLLAKRERR